jgi:AcrR family transcriptional regulator
MPAKSNPDSATAPAGRRTTKGERTRRALMDAALILLERDGFHDMKVTEVATTAGVSVGVFYIYFKDKTALTLAVFGEMIERTTAEVFAGGAPADAFDAVLETNRRYVAALIDTGGLMRATLQILDQLPEARAQWQAMNAKVARRIAAGMERRAPGAMLGEEARIFSAHAVQAMVDTILLNANTYRDPDLLRMTRNVERLAQALSILWYRALYGRSPKPEQCPDALDFLATRET